MSRLSLTALTIWALCFGVPGCGSAKVQGPQSGEMKTDEPAATVVTLTQDRPSNSLPIKAPGGSTSDADALEISITKVVNKSLTPITIDVYLSVSETGKAEPSRHLVGSYSLYPPDQPGKFLLNAKTVLQDLSQSDQTAKGHDVRFIFEMKRVDESKAWTPVELGIAQPLWRKAEK